MKTPKFFLLIIGFVFLCASFPLQAEEAVYSVNVVGFQKVELPTGGGFRFSAAPFEAGESNTLLDVFGTNSLRQSIFLPGCDRVILYDPQTQLYQVWAQFTDGKFYKANDGTEWAAKIEGNPEVPMGTGFWIMSATGSETNTILFVGDVVSSDTQLVDLVAGFQITAYPFSSDLDLSDTPDLVDSGAAKSIFLAGADRITVYSSETATYQTYALFTDGKWYKANDGAEWAEKIPADEIIPAGSAFWYQAVGSFTWTEDNPYIQIFQ